MKKRKNSKKSDNSKKDNGIKKSLQATIVKLDSGKNTIKVEIEERSRHKKYEKLMRFHKRYLVDVKEEDKRGLNVGDIVEIIETKPISKRKYFILKK